MTRACAMRCIRCRRSASCSVIERSADTPPDDPRLTGGGPEAETVGGPQRGTTEDPPDDPRMVGEGPEAETTTEMPTATRQPKSYRPPGALAQEATQCATCRKQFGSKNNLTGTHVRKIFKSLVRRMSPLDCATQLLQ